MATLPRFRRPALAAAALALSAALALTGCTSTDTTAQDPLDVDDEIRAAVAARRAADERLDAAVANARRLGRSWAKIGAVAGMTAQSANERWRNRT